MSNDDENMHFKHLASVFLGLEVKVTSKISLPLFLLILAGMMTWEGAWKNLEVSSVWNSVTSASRALLVLVSPACRKVSPPRPSAATLAVTVQLASVPVSFRRWSSRSDMRCWAAIAWNKKKQTASNYIHYTNILRSQKYHIFIIQCTAAIGLNLSLQDRKMETDWNFGATFCHCG